MKYTFVRTNGNGQRKRLVVVSMMDDISGLTEELNSKGWERLYDIPITHSLPGYHEAMEESWDVHRQNVKEGKAKQRENMENVHEALRDELR